MSKASSKLTVTHSLSFLLSAAYIGVAVLIYNLQNPLLNPSALVGYLGVMFALFVIWIILLKNKLLPHLALNWILGTSIIIQLIFLMMPIFYNDFFRYLWDGHMTVHGINPYLYFPWAVHDAPELQSLSKVWYWDQMHFRWMHTIYPPTFQYIFYLSNLIRNNGALVLKGIFMLFNIGSLWVGIKILQELKKPLEYILLLALHPLFLFETIAAGHAESIIIFFLLLTCYLHLRGEVIWSGISFAAAILTKFFPVLLFPLFLKQKQWWMFLIAALGATLMLYQPFLYNLTPALLYESFQHFQNQWVMSPGLFDLLQNFFSFDNAKILGHGATLAVVAWCLYRLKEKQDIFDSILLIFGTLIAFSSVVFSWYLLWLVCLFPFVRHTLPWLVLSGTIVLQYLLIHFDDMQHFTYVYLKNGQILESQLLIWVPALLALLYSLLPKHAK